MTMMCQLGKKTESAILFIFLDIVFALESWDVEMAFEVKRKWDNQLQKYLRHCTVFWLKWPVHDLVLVTPPPPLFKVASNTRPCSKLGGTTLNGRRRGVSILSHRSVTSSDLKQDRLFFRESVSTFFQLVVALYMGGSGVPSFYLVGTVLLESYVRYWSISFNTEDISQEEGRRWPKA